MSTVLIVLAVITAYLLVGYGWAMLFIHKLTDGRWATESFVTPGHYFYTPMGVGTAISFTVLWPFAIFAACIFVVGHYISKLFRADFWRRLYRIKD